MQIKTFLHILLTFFSLNSFGYECRVKELKLNKVENKKLAYHELRKLDRQIVVEGLLFELTSPQTTSKSKVKKTEVILSYLENSEVNSNQRSFFKLLATTSEVQSGKLKSSKLDEVCEIMGKVNELDNKKH